MCVLEHFAWLYKNPCNLIMAYYKYNWVIYFHLNYKKHKNKSFLILWQVLSGAVACIHRDSRNILKIFLAKGSISGTPPKVWQQVSPLKLMLGSLSPFMLGFGHFSGVINFQVSQEDAVFGQVQVRIYEHQKVKKKKWSWEEFRPPKGCPVVPLGCDFVHPLDVGGNSLPQQTTCASKTTTWSYLQD